MKNHILLIMKILFTSFALLSLSCMSLQAASVLVNFGNKDYSNSEVTDTGQGYNLVNEAGTYSNLNYSTGGASSYGLTITRNGNGGAGTGYGANLGCNDALVQWAADEDLRNLWYAASGTTDGAGVTDRGLGSGTSVTLTFTGLTQGSTYTLFMISGRGGTGTNNNQGSMVISGMDMTGDYDFQYYRALNGDHLPSCNVVEQADGLRITPVNNTNLLLSRYQHYNELTFVANASGQISFTINSTERYAIQAAGLTEVPMPIPEPSTALLGIFAMAGLSLKRRKA